MSPALLTFLIGEVIQYGPAVLAELESLFKSGQPTLADLQALRAKIEAESYSAFVPASAIPANVVPLVSPAPAPAGAVAITQILPPAPVVETPPVATVTPPPVAPASAAPVVAVTTTTAANSPACVKCGAALDGFNACPCPTVAT